MSSKLSTSSMKSRSSQPSTSSSSASSALRRSTTRALALGRMNANAAIHGGLRGQRGGHGHGDHEGFENLRNYIKQGAEFSKELVAALNERADLETNYRQEDSWIDRTYSSLSHSRVSIQTILSDKTSCT